MVAFVNLSSKHIHRQTCISSYLRLTREDQNNFFKRGLEKVSETLKAIITKHPANSQICEAFRGTVSVYKHDTEDRHTAFVKGRKLLVASPMYSFRDSLHQDSLSLLPLLKVQDSPCSPSIPSSRNTIHGGNLTLFLSVLLLNKTDFYSGDTKDTPSWTL